jgi:hypothetical protein
MHSNHFGYVLTSKTIVVGVTDPFWAIETWSGDPAVEPLNPGAGLVVVTFKFFSPDFRILPRFSVHGRVMCIVLVAFPSLRGT